MHREILWRVKIVTRYVTVKVLNSYQKNKLYFIGVD